MIEACRLTKVFRDKKRGEIFAAHDVSFRVPPGQIYGLLGANGAGKTTTLRLLATLLQPTRGTAAVAGFDVVRDAQAVRANVGFLAASTALYGRLTAREMITYFGRLNGMADPAIRARIKQLSAELDMDEFLDRRCDKFSTGMKQKTSIARTLVHDPAVMIFDEPTLGLDVMTARAIVRFVRDCRARGKTVIYSTHVMSEVEKLCDVIGIIHDGRLLAEGTLADLRARYAEQDLEEIFVKVVGVRWPHELEQHRHGLPEGAQGFAARPAHAAFDHHHPDPRDAAADLWGGQDHGRGHQEGAGGDPLGCDPRRGRFTRPSSRRCGDRRSFASCRLRRTGRLRSGKRNCGGGRDPGRLRSGAEGGRGAGGEGLQSFQRT
jgi:sodium transport system ATP-binding protein